MVGTPDNRVALVTGGSRGIGRATCLALAQSEAVVAVHYHNSADAAREVVASIERDGGRAAAFRADLAEIGAADALVAQVSGTFGKPDILVNNAGEQGTAPVAEMTDAEWSRALELNLSAAFRCARACIPGMIARGWGRIINVSSQAAYTGSANHAHYAAAKAGLAGLTFSLAKELGPAGITVNLVAPGRIETDMLAGQMAARAEEWLRQTPLRRFGQPEEVAAAIAFLASDGASYITGAALQVGGGLVMG
jgi:NAD(P)-dependent dehydrogenase (short-subunit alcohol dehydrogenase family)